MKIELVIFDMDGLMFDTERTYLEDHIKDFENLGYHLNIEPMIAGVGTSTPLDIKSINAGNHLSDEDFHKILMKSYRNSIDRIVREGIPIKKGLYDLLDKIEEKGIPKCVATSTPIEHSGRILKKANVFNRLNFILTAKDVKHGKPAPDIFLKACEIAGVKPENALVLEDSEGGCEAAYCGNIPFICVPDLKKPSKLTVERAILVADSLLDVIPVIDKSC